MSPRLRVVVISLALLGALGALVWFLSMRYGSQPVTPRALPQATEQTATTTPPLPAASVTASPADSVTSPSASPIASPNASPNASPISTPTAGATPAASSERMMPPANSAARLLIPVEGVRPEQLRDTFTAARSEGRVHDAIDIPAARGTPVLAAADGKIVKLFNSVRGGITIYQLAEDNRTIYYYAHLERYADGLTEGHAARRGETIAYVGDTGNAGAGNYHLHFSVSVVSDPKRWWDGENINPYPLLTQR